jgi:hypothetical protein
MAGGGSRDARRSTAWQGVSSRVTAVRGSLAGSGAVQPQPVAWFARLACGLALVLLTAGLLLLWVSAGGPLPESYSSRPEQAINLVGLLGPPLLGGLIVARRPSNPYGWLWAAYGLGWAVVGFTNAYVAYLSASDTGVAWWARPIAWVNMLAFVPLLGLTALILLLFPMGGRRLGAGSGWPGRLVVSWR